MLLLSVFMPAEAFSYAGATGVGIVNGMVFAAAAASAVVPPPTSPSLGLSAGYLFLLA